MNKRAERIISKIYQEVFKKVFNKKTISQIASNQKRSIATGIFQLQSSKQYEEFAKKFAKKLSAAGLSKQKHMWRKYYNAAKQKHIGILPDTYSEYEKQVFTKAMQHNFKMIKSIPEKVLSVYEQKDIKTAIDQVVSGKIGRKAFESTLKQHGAKNAKLIARTETAKLQTAVDEHRSTSLGSVCYRWVSSNDRRTRKSHRAMNDVIVFWRPDNQKPLLDKMRGNAGEFPNCRCTTEPLFDENDFEDNFYKVYDYRIDKVVSISKKKLIESIRKGAL